MKDDAKQTLTPKLRFPEFRKGWTVTPLSQLATFLNERVGTTECTPYTVTSGVGLMSQQEKLGRTIAGNSLKSYVVLQKDAFAYNKSATKAFPEGFIARYLGDDRAAVPNSIFTCFRVDDGSVRPAYLDYLFSANLHGRWLRNFITIGARAHGSLNVNDDDLMSLPVPLPDGPSTLIEQQKIADCLTSLDEVIAAQGRKVEALKVHKKGLMQQLFPREGETVPRLRFPEFRDESGWNKRRLRDFISERCEIANGTVPLFSLTIENGVTAKTDRYERSFLVTNKEDAYKLVLPNDFAFNPMNLRFGAIGRHSGSEAVALSKYYNIFYCDQSVDARFCELYFRSDEMIAYYDTMATGSLIEKRRVHFDRFLDFSIPFPGFQEQREIADSLSFIDAQIAAESEKLNALKTHKKGLMQQLFPSPEGD